MRKICGLASANLSSSFSSLLLHSSAPVRRGYFPLLPAHHNPSTQPLPPETVNYFSLHISLKSHCVRVQSCSAMSKSLQPRGLQPPRLLCPWGFPGKDTGVGCHVLLQVFLTQGLNPHLLRLLYWQAYSLPLVPFGKKSPQVREILKLKYEGLKEVSWVNTSGGACMGACFSVGGVSLVHLDLSVPLSTLL